MKIDVYFEKNSTATIPVLNTNGARQRAQLMALRKHEFELWQATGGDFLASKPKPTTAGQKGQNRIQLWSVMVFGALATLLLGCTGSNGKTAPVPTPPPEVAVRRVTEQSIPTRYELTGQAVASHQVEVRARVGGYVTHVAYTEGEFVEAGQLLFEIDSRPFVALLAKADAEVARAQAAIKLKRQELARAERLAASDAIATEELDRRRTELETASAGLASAVAQREAAALDVEFTKVKSPVAGRVSRAMVRPGNLVSGGDANGTLLATLVATTPLHVHFNLDEPAYQRLAVLRKAGQTVQAQLKLGGNDDVIEGRLDYIAPFLDARSGTAQARVVIENADGKLSPGLFARVTLTTLTDEAGVLIPETAIGAQQGSRYVLLVGKENQVEHRQVTLGERRGTDRVVTSGLHSGESIVINGLQRIRPGMTVQPVEASIAAN